MSRVRTVPFSPRLVDWSIFACLGFELASGLLSLVTGRPGGEIVFVLHGIVGISLCALVFWKLRRVRKRVTRLGAWDRKTPVSVLLTVVTLSVLGSGIFWVLGGSLAIGPWGLLNLHIGLGLVLVVVVGVHLYHRFRPPRRSDFEGRRTALSYLLLVGAGALSWRIQELVNRLVQTPGAGRRFTGSREEGTDAGNAFPVTSWVADDPDPIALGGWRLTVGGKVNQEFALSYDDLVAERSLRATLDCTSGWYSAHDWHGVRVGDLLDRAEVTERAQWVSFRSVTGYRWSLPIAEAREALLATHAGDERLTHGHGFPLRLVAPGRRGFQWVKWVVEIEVRDRKDPGQWLAVFVSGFEDERGDEDDE